MNRSLEDSELSASIGVYRRLNSCFSVPHRGARVTLNLIRPDMLARLLLVESIAPVTPVPDAARRLPIFSEGQRFLATVEAQLADGDFQVQVNGRVLQMNLPQSARPGDRMELMLIVREPRLKFLLLSEGQSRAGADVTLSATGRFLGALALDAAKSPAPSLTGAAPVFGSPPADSRQLPELLRVALSQSGLFYESHQAQWVAGKRSLGQLLQEPQGGLSSGFRSQSPELRDASQTSALNSQLSTLSSQSVEAVTGTVRNANAPVHEQTLTLVQQQLNTLETGLLSWRGEIWPGQWMEWDIAEHPPAEHETEDLSRWQTRLRLTLPKLGEVAATLALDSRGVRITLGATATGTAALLESSQQPLAAGMAAAGLSVLAVEVRHDAEK